MDEMKEGILFHCVGSVGKGLGVGDCRFGGRMVVVGQVDFQANQLS